MGGSGGGAKQAALLGRPLYFCIFRFTLPHHPNPFSAPTPPSITPLPSAPFLPHAFLPFPPLPPADTAAQVPLRALNARSLSGSIVNLAAGLALAVSAAVLAFNAVPAAQLGAARPEAAWAFFWARATALMVLSEGACLSARSEQFLSLFRGHRVA